MVEEFILPSSLGDTTVHDNFHKIKIVIKKLDCFGSNEPHNDAQLVVSRNVIAKAILHFTSLLVVIPTSREVYCKMKQSSLLLTIIFSLCYTYFIKKP